MNKLFKYGSLEERFFAIVTFCTIPYYILNLITILSYDDTSYILVAIYIFLLFVSFTSYYFIWKNTVKYWAIGLFSIFLLFAFTYYLPKSAGPIGGSGYVIQNIIVLLILMNKGPLKVFVTLMLCGVSIVLFTDAISFSGQIIHSRLITDYLVNLIFISLFMLFFKYSFDTERKELRSKNDQLEKLNMELTEQADQLQETNDEIKAIRDNLQQKVEERTRKLRRENEKLRDYSFINAHLVRAPMANIIGITNMDPDNPDYKEISKGILEMDQVVRKIADVLD